MRPAPQYSHHYPTELGLLKLARLDSEKIIDILYKNIKAKFHKKIITDLNLAIIDYLVLAKQRRPSRNKRRQTLHQTLPYIKINLAHIEQLIELGSTRKSPNKKQYKTLLVAEIYRPQPKLFENKK
jgi:IS5 family transposase